MPLGGVPEINNDHVVSPDGTTVYVSAEDGALYAVRLDGESASVRKVSRESGDFRHYLHGVSRDGSTLAYIGLSWQGERRVTNVSPLPLDGGDEVQLTDDAFQDDGAEFGPGPDRRRHPHRTEGEAGQGRRRRCDHHPKPLHDQGQNQG